ncbi:MAG: type 4b pilus protein PilO2, partial [Bilophila sp.]
MRLVLINKRMYAVGLQWQLGGEAPRSVLRKEAQTLDSALDMVVICPRQHGFGTSNGTPLPFTRARSLSASLRMPFGSFLGLFALETTDSAPLWWVIAFSKGVFTAFSDMTFTEREDAEKQVNELRNLLEKVEQSVVCDTPQESAAWLSPLLKTGLLEEFFGHSRVQSLVEIPGQRKKIAAFGAVVLCVLLSGFGISTFLEYQAGQRAVEQARLAFMDKEKHRQDVLAHPERHFPMPWTTEPTVLDKANVCLPELLRLPLVVNGWELDAATC